MSPTETALSTFFAALVALAQANAAIPAPVRNEALPSRLAEAANDLEYHLNLWDGDTEVDTIALGADVLPDGYDLTHKATLEWVVAGGTSDAREAAFDAGIEAVNDMIKADRTLGGVVARCEIEAVQSAQRRLVTEGMPNTKGADIIVAFEFVSSSVR
jgi:hypothetical protein